MATLHTCIISWRGQHDNACRIAQQVSRVSDATSLVYSDPDPAYIPSAAVELIRRPDALFFGDKFKACLDAFAQDQLLVIHADCHCADWAGLAAACRSALAGRPEIGVWAPRIHYTGFGLERTQLGKLGASSLSLVAHTDTIVFGLGRAVAERMKHADYSRNVYGWGIGWMCVAHAYAHQRVAVVDRSIQVRHPQPRGYPSDDAARQRGEFLGQLTPAEQVQCRLLESHMRMMDLLRRRAAPGAG